MGCSICLDSVRMVKMVPEQLGDDEKAEGRSTLKLIEIFCQILATQTAVELWFISAGD